MSDPLTPDTSHLTPKKESMTISDHPHTHIKQFSGYVRPQRNTFYFVNPPETEDKKEGCSCGGGISKNHRLVMIGMGILSLIGLAALFGGKLFK